MAPRASDAALAKAPGLRKALIASLPKPDECGRLSEGGTDEIEIQRLDAQHVLASTSCFVGAYNMSNAYWVVRDKSPYQATLSPTSPKILTAMTLRCEAVTEAAVSAIASPPMTGWDGERFVKSSDFTTGQCRNMLGGHWILPTVVSEVR